jgi:[acyl-carrier-protein] S-malonyltransferase
MTLKACVFPGQGSQSVGMLSDVVAEYDVAQQTFEQASDALGYDLWALISEGPKENLNQTDKTQPALLASSVALWRVLEQKGLSCDYMAGHSLGEYSALVCAGALHFEQALKLVESRGQYMQQAVPSGVGAMYAIIGLDDEAIKVACQNAAQGEIVAPVNYNSPGQVVIAGNAAAVERAGVLCKETGAKKAMPLAVSVPSHCDLMRPAAEQLQQALESISVDTPRIPVINNVDVLAETDAANIKQALIRQLYSPVRWTESVQKLATHDVTSLLEIGPGKVLTGLTKRIDKSITASAVNTVDSIEALFEG